MADRAMGSSRPALAHGLFVGEMTDASEERMVERRTICAGAIRDGRPTATTNGIAIGPGVRLPDFAQLFRGARDVSLALSKLA